MPLTNPPEVQIGSDPAWHPTAWATVPPTVERTGPGVETKLDRAAREFLYFTVTLGDEAAQTARLLCSGPEASTPGDVALPHGRSSVRLRVNSNPEAIVRSAGVIVVV